jgi:signal transduction histidine kinase
MFRTLRFKITALYVLSFGVTLLMFSGFLYVINARAQSEDFDKFLYNRAQAIARSISITVQGELEINQALIAESGKLFPFQFGNEYIEILSPEGKVMARSRNLGTNDLPMNGQMMSLLQAGQFAFITLPLSTTPSAFWSQGDLRMVSVPLFANGKLQILLQLGVSTHALDQSLARLWNSLFFIGVPLTLLFAGAGGWWLAGRAFDPINKIVVAAQKMGAERLGERLPVPEADDELGRLSTTLNEMLNRLEGAFKSQERFVADASHELKTPITVLKGELEVLRSKPRSSEEYRVFVDSALEELARLTQIIENLLVLARADSGRPLKLDKTARLDEVILGVIGRLQSFATQAQVKLGMTIADPMPEDELSVRGDPDLLASLFFNLIHNAIKYSAAGQTVETRIQSGPSVEIRDHGTGISAEDIPHIFERFHRAENPSRSEVKGTGLGLAIAKWIADAHGATISVTSRPAEGSTFAVRFGS